MNTGLEPLGFFSPEKAKKHASNLGRALAVTTAPPRVLSQCFTGWWRRAWLWLCVRMLSKGGKSRHFRLFLSCQRTIPPRKCEHIPSWLQELITSLLRQMTTSVSMFTAQQTPMLGSWAPLAQL